MSYIINELENQDKKSILEPDFTIHSVQSYNINDLENPNKIQDLGYAGYF